MIILRFRKHIVLSFLLIFVSITLTPVTYDGYTTPQILPGLTVLNDGDAAEGYVTFQNGIQLNDENTVVNLAILEPVFNQALLEGGRIYSDLVPLQFQGAQGFSFMSTGTIAGGDGSGPSGAPEIVFLSDVEIREPIWFPDGARIDARGNNIFFSDWGTLGSPRGSFIVGGGWFALNANTPQTLVISNARISDLFDQFNPDNPVIFPRFQSFDYGDNLALKPTIVFKNCEIVLGALRGYSGLTFENRSNVTTFSNMLIQFEGSVKIDGTNLLGVGVSEVSDATPFPYDGQRLVLDIKDQLSLANARVDLVNAHLALTGTYVPALSQHIFLAANNTYGGLGAPISYQSGGGIFILQDSILTATHSLRHVGYKIIVEGSSEIRSTSTYDNRLVTDLVINTDSTLTLSNINLVLS